MGAPSFNHVASLAKLSLDDASSALGDRDTFLALLSRLSEVLVPTDRVERLLLILSLLAEEDAPWLDAGLTISIQPAGDGLSLMTLVVPDVVLVDGAPTFFLPIPVEDFGIAIMSNPDSAGGLKARFDGSDLFFELPRRRAPVLNVPGGPVTHETRRIPSVVVPAAARPTPLPGGNRGGSSS